MGTRSAIGYKTSNGIRGVYCHWDGYVSHNGRILHENYQAAYKICSLIESGDISSLGPEVGVKHDFSRLDSDLDAEEYEAKYGNMTTFYYRDREESYDATKTKEFADIAEFVDYFDGSGCEYFYLFTGREWIVNKRGAKDDAGFPVFDRVEDVLEETVA